MHPYAHVQTRVCLHPSPDAWDQCTSSVILSEKDTNRSTLLCSHGQLLSPRLENSLRYKF